MSRTLVTGATGFVGGRLVRRLRDAGEPVVAVVRAPSAALDDLGVDQHRGDLTDAAGLDQLLAPGDTVVHAAASVGADLDDARRVNRDGTAALARAALRAEVRRFVHVSTTSVYDRDRAGDQVDEDAPLVTDGRPYAVSKAEAEVEVVRARDEGLPVSVLRPPAILGAGPTSNWGVSVPTRLGSGEMTPPPAAETLPWVHVDDLVDALLAARDAGVDLTANVIGGQATWGDYLAALTSFLPDVAEAEHTAATATATPWTGRYTTDRLPAVLGLRPARTFEAGLAEIADWWRRSNRGRPPDASP